MKPTFNDKLIAYLALFSGLVLSLVAEYYSIAGLTAIFSAAVIPTVIMGIALGLGKVIGTIWLKQNWKIVPWPIKVYLCSAIALLMLITAMGIFGFLSKAHSDQSLVSGDVLAKVAIYDEKIKTSKDNIETNRRALKQMDEAVDQVMGRSQDEKGADKAVAIRRGQQKERARILAEIGAEQKILTQLSEERAPIAAEVRKVEAEVGPIKYIAAFVYGATDDAILERAVTWVILLIIFVFDPLALILLISSQISFQKFKEDEQPEINWQERTDELLTVFEEGDSPVRVDEDVVSPQPTVTESKDTESEVKSETVKYTFVDEVQEPDYPADDGPLTDDQIDQLKTSSKPLIKVLEGDEAVKLMQDVGIFDKEGNLAPEYGGKDIPDVERPGDYLNEPAYVQNEEQSESNLWSNVSAISQEDYQQASQAKLENHVDEIVELIKTGYLNIDDVPKYIQKEVKAKL